MTTFGAKRIFIANIGYDVTENALVDDFTQFGEIDHCQIVKQPETQKSRGFGFIIYQSCDSARAATRLNRTKYRGRLISVEIARQQYAKQEYIQQGIGRMSRGNSPRSASSSPPNEMYHMPIPFPRHQQQPIPFLTGFENLNLDVRFVPAPLPNAPVFPVLNGPQSPFFFPNMNQQFNVFPHNGFGGVFTNFN